MADRDEVMGEHFSVFDIYVADTEGVVRRHLKGSKEARPRLDHVLEAVAEVAGKRAPRMHSEFGKIVVEPSRGVKAARRAAAEAITAGTAAPADVFAAPGRGAGDAHAPAVLDARWMWSHPETRPGDTLKLALMPRVAHGFHVYAHDEGRMSPFTVEVDLPDGLELAQPIRHPAGTTTRDPVLDIDLSMHSGDIPLPALVLRAFDDVEPGELEVVVRFSYQACNDAICLAPATQELRLTVPIVAAGTERGQVFGWQGW